MCALFVSGAESTARQERLDPAAWGDSHARKPQPEFYGGDECLFCHRATVGLVWEKDPHFRAVRDKYQEGGVAREIEALKRDPKYAKLADEVGFVLGSKDAVRFLKRGEGGRFELLNVLMSPGREGKPPRFASASKPAWDAGEFSANCIGCHMTGVEPRTLRPFETFVGCESCHGPFDDKHTTAETFMRFARKAKDPPRVIASACGQCHLRGGVSRSSGRPFPTNFISGDNLFKDFAFDFSKADSPELNPIDAHIQRNIRDIVVGGDESLTCLSCHKMHPPSTRNHRFRPKSEYCLTCHKAEPFNERKAYEVHSHVCRY